MGRVFSRTMDETLLAEVLERLHEVETALVETETRIDDSVENQDARRSLDRAQKLLESALKVFDRHSES